MSDAPQPMQPPFVMPAMLPQRMFGAPAVPDIFANQLRMGVGVTDFTVVFGVGGESVSNGPPIIIDKVIVHVAPGMLKQMLLNFAMAVEAYEEVVGPIRVPHAMNEQIAAIKAHLVATLRQVMDGTTPPMP